jgi:hypothetical protein
MKAGREGPGAFRAAVNTGAQHNASGIFKAGGHSSSSSSILFLFTMKYEGFIFSRDLFFSPVLSPRR